MALASHPTNGVELPTAYTTASAAQWLDRMSGEGRLTRSTHDLGEGLLAARLFRFRAFRQRSLN